MKRFKMLLDSFRRSVVAKSVSAGIACLLFFYFFCLTFNEPTEIGIARDRLTGVMWKLEGGWHLTAPWVSVARIDTRPIRVGVQSSGRGYSEKLVQFDPDYWQEFVDTEGFRYYWWSNRISFNWDHKEEYRGMADVLVGYAYGTKKYRFLKILQEFKN